MWIVNFALLTARIKGDFYKWCNRWSPNEEGSLLDDIENQVSFRMSGTLQGLRGEEREHALSFASTRRLFSEGLVWRFGGAVVFAVALPFFLVVWGENL